MSAVTSSVRLVDRQVLYGLLFLGLVGLIVAATVAQYRGAFQDNVGITVEADRAGLTLARGAPVKLHGVEIGHVGHVALDAGAVRIELEIEHDKVSDVPANVTAQIVPPTAFGAKYVQLTVPASAASRPIAAGAVIPATRVTVEVDQAFENLVKVLDVARPADVNAALTAMAGAVDQRGQRIGNLISQADRYLISFNPSLPQLSSDLRATSGVFSIYEAARPDLIRTLQQTGAISDTLVRQHGSLRAFERSLSTFSRGTDVLLRRSAGGLVTTLSLLQPVSRTLQRYSPEFPCLVLGLARTNRSEEAPVGGARPGLTTLSRLVPTRPAYTYPSNLPRLGEQRGPGCYGLPYVTPQEAAQPPPWLMTGANPYAAPNAGGNQAALRTLKNALIGEVAP